MYTPLCKREILIVCEFVINDVIENIREDFKEEGLDEATLQDFKSLWNDKLMETNAIDKVEVENIEKVPEPTVPKQVNMGKTLLNGTQKYTVGNQFSQGTRQIFPIQATHQVLHRNLSNGVSVQNRNIVPPKYINRSGSSNSYHKIDPTNQMIPNLDSKSQFVVGNTRLPTGQIYQIVNQDGGPKAHPVNMSTIPTASQINNQRLMSNNNQLQNSNRYSRSQNSVPYSVPRIINRGKNVNFRQSSNNVHATSAANAQISNVRPRTGYQNLNCNYRQQFLTTHPSGSEILVPVSTGTVVFPRQVQQSAQILNARPIRTGLPSQQNVIFRQSPNNVHATSAANAQISNVRPRTGYQNPNYNYRQQFLTTHPSGSEILIPVNNTGTVVFPSQLQQSAMDVRFIQPQNMIPTSIANNQGNLNQIMQPVDQSNSISFDDIIQIDGVADSLSDGKDDVEFMSSSDSDDGIDDAEQGNAIQNLEKVEFSEKEDTEFMSDSDDNIGNEEQGNDVQNLESHESQGKQDVEFMSSSDSDDEEQGNDVQNLESDDDDDEFDDLIENDIEADEQTENKLSNDDVQKETLEGNADDDSEKEDDDNEKDTEKNDNQEIDDVYEPLNSDDDINIENTEELFESENIIICTYPEGKQKHQKMEKWKMNFNDGFMHLKGKEYVFKSALVQAFFLAYDLDL